MGALWGEIADNIIEKDKRFHKNHEFSFEDDLNKSGEEIIRILLHHKKVEFQLKNLVNSQRIGDYKRGLECCKKCHKIGKMWEGNL